MSKVPTVIIEHAPGKTYELECMLIEEGLSKQVDYYKVEHITLIDALKALTIEELTDCASTVVGVYGCNSFTRVMFKLLKRPITPFDCYPDRLEQSMYKRSIIRIEWGEFLKNVGESIPPDVFIKPVIGKPFRATVIKKESQWLRFKRDMVERCIDDETPVYLSNVVDFQSEWRCYISGGCIAEVNKYKGSFRAVPDYAVIDKWLLTSPAFRKSPHTFALDVGVLKDGSTAIVEANDFLAIGAYGIDADLFATLLLKRSKEIFG